MLNETNINCFLSLCETLSFTESARRLYLSQQAVSKNVMQLENDLGLRLINRGSRSITISPAGMQVEEIFRRQKTEFYELVANLKEENDREGKTLAIGLQDFLDFGPELYEANIKMRDKYPDLLLSISRYSPGLLNKKLENGELDIIIAYDRYVTTAKPHHNVVLFEANLNIIVSENHPLVNEQSSYFDFINEPYIVDQFEDETNTMLERRVNEEMKLGMLDPQGIISVPNRETAYLMADLGKGIILGSDSSQMFKGSRMTRFRSNRKTTISCCWMKNENTSKIDNYIKIMKECYEHIPRS